MSVPADRRGRFQVNLAIIRLMLSQRRGDLPTVVEEAQRLLGTDESADAAPPGLGQVLRAVALVSLGTAELWALRSSEAERHLEQGVALASQIGRPWLGVSALAHGAWARSFHSFGSAAQRYLQAIELAQDHGWTEEPVVAPAYAGLGAIRVWQMHLEEAETLLEHAERALHGEVEPAAVIVMHQARGMLELARGHDGKAMTAFKSAERVAGLLVAAHPRSTPMRAHMLQTMVRMGDTEHVEQALAGLDETERGETRNALAALRLAQGEPQAATLALAPVLDGSAPVTNLGWMSQAFLLEAIARDALGDPVAAGQALERALDIVEPDGAVFAFLMHPAPELLWRHSRRGTAHAALITKILDLMAGNKPIPEPRVGPDRLREPLSGSEARVLRFMPTNLSAPEIASQLSVSVNTVRTHMRHLYEKLGVHSRTEAVERARALGLLAQSSRRP
jgi:LuxR family transcriptional regulator, maltose regulon positive regulatory protein